MMFNKILVVYLKPKHNEEKNTLKTVFNRLNKSEVTYYAVPRQKIREIKNINKKYELVIAVGGDGTFLKASQHITSLPILGVNSDVSRKEGCLMQCKKDDFEKKFGKLIKDDFKIMKINRLNTKIGKRELPSALNEVFISHKSPYKISKFDFYIGKKYEYQKCSGIIISTAIGSKGWATSAKGRVIPIKSRDYQYVIREPYQGRLHQHKFIKGIIRPNENATIKILKNDYILAIDSIREFKLKKGDIITIGVSKTPLNYIWFNRG